MYQRLQGYARTHQPRRQSELGRYLREYQQATGTIRKLSHKKELVQAVIQAPIVIVGDYHTLPQAQRTLVRLLREVHENTGKKPLVIALEWLAPEDNPSVLSFLKGRIGEKRFLKEVRFHRRWGFPWENYRPLFEFAQTNGLMIIGLSKKGARSLKSRDQFAAERLVALFRLYPNAHCLALVGDLHLSDNHLPGVLRHRLRRLGMPQRVLAIHQNIERFYWTLTDQGLQDKIDVVQMTLDSYCVLATPPWLKLQSHLQWLELTSEAADQRSYTSVRSAFGAIDFSDEVSMVTQQIRSFLGLPMNQPLPDFQVLGPSDLGFLSKIHLSQRDRAALKMFLTHFESFFIPSANILYLTNLSPNQLASQSAIFLHSSLSSFDQIFTSPLEQFYDFIWVEALGFLGSKVLNPKRKYQDLKNLTEIAREKKIHPSHHEFQVTPDIARWCVTHLKGKLKNLFPRQATPERLLFYYKNAKTLGHLLGGSFYHATLAGRIDKHTLLELFTRHPPNARLSYNQWIQRLDRWNLSPHDKREMF